MHRQSLIPWNWFEKETDIPKQHHCSGQFSGYPAHFGFFFKDMDTFMNRILGAAPSDFLRSGFLSRLGDQTVQMPKMDINGDDKQYTIQVELPGVEEKHLQVEVKKQLLTIGAEKKCGCATSVKGEEKGQEDADKKRKGYYCQERSYGYFQRALTLPEDADTENIHATFKNGVLNLTIPRKVPVLPNARRIAVNTE